MPDGPRPKAAGISDAMVISAMRQYMKENPDRVWVSRWAIQERLPQFPVKVVNAKLRSMVLRNKISGCSQTHNCRGDFECGETDA